MARQIIEAGNAILNRMDEEAKVAKGPLPLSRIAFYERELKKATGMSFTEFSIYLFKEHDPGVYKEA
jgi:hypothetical protein